MKELTEKDTVMSNIATSANEARVLSMKMIKKSWVTTEHTKQRETVMKIIDSIKPVVLLTD